MIRTRLLLASLTYLIGIFIALGFIFTDVHLPVFIELILKILAVISVLLIIGVMCYNVINGILIGIRKHSLGPLINNPLSLLTTSFSLLFLLISASYLTGHIYGKAVVGAIVYALLFSLLVASVFSIAQIGLRYYLARLSRH